VSGYGVEKIKVSSYTKRQPAVKDGNTPLPPFALTFQEPFSIKHHSLTRGASHAWPETKLEEKKE
jgi:hypothetical protein